MPYDGFNEELNKRISYEIYSENLFGQKHYSFAHYPLERGRKLNIFEMFRKLQRRLLSVLCTFNQRPVLSE